MSVVLINGKAYDYTNVICNILGVPVAGISSINYKETQEKTNNMGTGNRPVSRGHGPINADGSLEISMNDTEAIRQVVASKSMLDIPMFDIIIVFGHPTSPKTHVLKNVEFKTDGVEMTQGDTDVKMGFDIVLSHVEYR